TCRAHAASTLFPYTTLFRSKTFGISSSLRHLCAACMPANITFFKYDWRKEVWNLFFVGGITLGAFIAAHYLSNPDPVQLAASTRSEEHTSELQSRENLVCRL